MVSEQLLIELDNVLQMVKSNSLTFGGLSVFLFGDFYQHLLVMGKAVYVSKAWKITDYICLQEQMRYGSDQRLTDFIRKIRNHDIDQESLDYANSRCISLLPNAEEFLYAPFLTTNNATAYRVIQIRATEIPRSFNTPLFLCMATDTVLQMHNYV